jgi:hypothetical protein
MERTKIQRRKRRMDESKGFKSKIPKLSRKTIYIPLQNELILICLKIVLVQLTSDSESLFCN